MTTLVLVNAKSGAVRDRGRNALLTEIRDSFAAAGAEAEILAIHPRELTGRIRAALGGASPPETLVVGGGDGSLSCAAGLLAGTGTTLGVLPLGTMNLFARALGMPLDPAEATGALVGARRVEIDLLDINGRTVLLHASIGLQPRIIRIREMLPYRTRLMRLTNGLIAWIRATRRLRPVRITGQTDHGSFERAASALLISNNALSEGLGEAPVAHDLTRGEIAVYICASNRRSDLVKLALAGSLGLWRQSDLVEEIITRQLDIDTRKRTLLLALDGELARMEPPLACRSRRRSLAVLIPRQDGTGGADANAREAVL